MAEPKLSVVKPRPRVAIVGGDSLLAKELRELLEEAKPSPRIELISASAENATVLEPDDESAIAMVPLSAESLTGAKVAFLAGSPSSSRRALKANPQGGPALIDLSGALEEMPEARLRAPALESNVSYPSGTLHVIAHPAAIAIVTLLVALGKRATIRRSIIHVFEPASERGKKGLAELQQQTTAVLSFQKLKTDIFDTQLAFSMLARFGDEAVEPLEEIEHRIVRHLASLLAAQDSQAGVPMPSVRAIQAPVFHGHSFSVWIEFAEESGRGVPENTRERVFPEEIPQGQIGGKLLAEWLEQAGIDVRPDEPPTNANIAGISGLSVGAINPDANHPRAFWLWMVSDNLRLTAENALAVAWELL